MCQYTWHFGEYDEYLDSDQNYLGKKAVLKAYIDILSNDSLKKDLYRTIFVVDRDYDVQVVCSDVGILEDAANFITTTRYHSHENYYLTDHNLRIIFKELGVQKYLVDFKIKFTMFGREISRYCALKAANSACYDHGWKKPYYRVLHKDNEILDVHFNSEGNYSFNKLYLIEEIALLEQAIKGNKNAEEYFNDWFVRISDDPLNIRGHTIYNFLIRYLIEVCHVRFSISKDEVEYFSVIKKMSVPICLIYGNGVSKNTLESQEKS